MHKASRAQGTIVKHNVWTTCSCGWRSQLVDSRRIDASARLREAFKVHTSCWGSCDLPGAAARGAVRPGVGRQ